MCREEDEGMDILDEVGVNLQVSCLIFHH